HEALRVNPRFFWASSHLGRIAHLRRDLDKARKLYEKTVTLAPHLVEDLAYLGSVLVDLGRVDAGVKCLREAIRREPSLAVAHGMLGVALLEKLKQVDEAVSCFENAVALQPAEGRYYFHLGFAYARQGQFDKSIDSHLKSAKLGHNRETAQQIANTLLA